MRKFRLVITVIMLAFTVGMTAQHYKVQGIERNRNLSPASATADVATNVDFNDILYWVGDGDKSSAVVIKWDDGNDNKKLLVWGYKWSTAEEGTGTEMLKAIAKADPRFYLLTYNDSPFGTSIGGMGFDLDNDNDIALLYNGEEHVPVDGIVDISNNSFDDYQAKDGDDHWNAGWMNGYWSYWYTNNANNVYQYSSVGASERTLVDGSVDGWAFLADMKNWDSIDMSGDIEYVKAPQASDETDGMDYTTGKFVLNEGWFGNENSTLNYIDGNGKLVYRAFQKENPGMELGATAEFATIYGDRLYVIAKQAQTSGTSVKGGRLTICDAKTLKCIKQFENIYTDDKGLSVADGHAFLGVNENKAYISTNNGIYMLDIEALEVKGKLTGNISGSESSSDNLCGGQIGTMVRVNENVFAVSRKNGILVFDADADTLKTVIGGPDKWSYGSVVLSKDGNVWASVSAASGSGQAAPFIMKINPETCDTTRVNMPEGIYPPANSWYAWTPDGFCASTQQNVLYWNGGESSWESGKLVFRYDIDSNKFEKFIDFNEDPDSWQIYGCSFRIDPATDHAVVSLYKDFGETAYIVREYDYNGNVVNEYALESNYWFPSLPLFPDNGVPVVAGVEDIRTESTEAFTVSLASIATDTDNIQAAIVKTVKDISDREVVDAVIRYGNLDITPQGKSGQADITIGINSNGKLAETTVSVLVETSTSVDGAEAYKSIYFYDNTITVSGYKGYEFALYNITGQQIMRFTANSDLQTVSTALQSGTYILRGTDGKHNVSFKFISE